MNRLLNNILWWAGVLVVAILVLGYFRGWYSFSKTGDEKETKINLTIHKKKIGKDKKEAKQKASQLKQKGKKKFNEMTAEEKESNNTLLPPNPTSSKHLPSSPAGPAPTLPF